MGAAFVYQDKPPAALRRSVVEDMVQRLVDLLDDLDGDADTEPANDDEPTLGSGFEDGECEPYLGSLAADEDTPQTAWSAGTLSDYEAGTDEEGEPEEREDNEQPPGWMGS